MKEYAKSLLRPIRQRFREQILHPAGRKVERSLAQVLARSRSLRYAASLVADGLGAALAAGPEIYSASYFGVERGGERRSGYVQYDRQTSRANIAAYLLWKNFGFRSSLDVGCALGFLVEALRELKVDAWGSDISADAISLADAAVRPFLRQGDLSQGLPFESGRFELISCFEILEHLPPERVPEALTELARVCGGHLLATIPSFGPNPHGPSGWFPGKVRWPRVEHYSSLGPEYDGPVPFYDLLKDADGTPIEGHLTIASFRWWTRQFARAGLERCPEIEAAIQPDFERFGLRGVWDLYVLRKPGASAQPARRAPEEVAALEQRWGLGMPRPQ
ncbi:MAG TPA: methyltransferase domain-containing protein [Hyalangium sp.]|nr:methyltransferase domain-containing protein [Hyalangium sp.]